mmetsp:Transcript_5484/g.23215  ORF Transcript_5484/g.23215 Transcript_5484/m.23215 type:complete len:240 (+) Transcript_5484:752-1471(+)
MRAASRSNTSMKRLPMALRFFSGSLTPASLPRNSSEASTQVRLTPHSSRRRLTTLTASSLRSRPLSTRTAWKRSPMARFMSTAATVESTPPLTAPMTRPVSPTVARMVATASSTKPFMLQSQEQPQMFLTKLLSMVTPPGVCWTSGWNWRPKMRRAECSMEACSEEVVMPVVTKPSGRATILSPWLIHTGDVSPRPSKREAWPAPSATACLIWRSACPNSRLGAASTLPPMRCTSSWKP